MQFETQRRREIEAALHSADLFVRLHALHILHEWEDAEFDIEQKINEEVATLIAASAPERES